MLKRRVAAIAWRVGTGVSAETRLNEQAGSGGLIEFELAIQAGRCNRGRSRWQADAVEVGPHGTRLDKRRQDLHATRATGTHHVEALSAAHTRIQTGTSQQHRQV